MKRLWLRRLAATALGFALWLPVLRYGIDATRPSPSQLAERLTVALAEPWSVDVSTARVEVRERAANPEWDFMARTFLVLALANEAEAYPDRRQRLLPIIDRLIADTLAAEQRHGMHHFLLPYGRHGAFLGPGGRSLFVDGEVALMLAARHLIAPDPTVERELRRRVDSIVTSMETGPVLSGESYPNECWTFCNTTALAALAVADAALGQDHGDLQRRWVARARTELVDPDTGMLVSSYTWDGQTLDGPEGSSIWMSAHNLLLVDAEFATEQFNLAREHLGRRALGFGWSREWPTAANSRMDIDSGPVVPILDASPGASGMALIGASAFGDDLLRDDLLRSLELAAFPVHDGQGTSFAAAGNVGSSVVAYALRFGPLWKRVRSARPGAV